MTDKSRARLIRQLNHLRSVAIVAFCLGIAIPAATYFIVGEKGFMEGSWIIRALVLPSAAMLLLSPPALLSSIVARDVLTGKWHFSIRTLLIGMTLVAIMLGVVAYVLNG